MQNERMLRDLLDVQNDLQASSEILKVIGAKLARVASAHARLLREYGNLNNVALPREQQSERESRERQLAESAILAVVGTKAADTIMVEDSEIFVTAKAVD